MLFVVAGVIVATIVYGTILYSKRNDGLAARVDGVLVYQSDHLLRTQQIKRFYQVSKHPITDDALRKKSLNNLIDEQLIDNYATDHSINVSDQEVLDIYSQRLHDRTEKELLSTISKQYGTNKAEYLSTIQHDAMRAKVQHNVKQPLADWMSDKRQTSNITIY